MRYTANQQQQLLSQAHKENRLVHLCIDNQYSMFTHHTRGNRRDWQELGEEVADFTNQLSVAVPTINVQFHVDDSDRGALKALQMPVTQYYYDPQNLKMQKQCPSDNNPIQHQPIWNDLLNDQAYRQYVFVKYHNDAFEPVPNQKGRFNPLDEFIDTNNFDTLVISGMFGDACVKSTASSAVRKHKCNVIMVSDQVIFGHKLRLENPIHKDAYKNDRYLKDSMIMHSTEIFETLGIISSVSGQRLNVA
jgi:nicotinamidase-related amidase